MSRNEEIKKMFNECHSNLEAPLIGRVYTPACYRCKNLIEPADPFEDCKCVVFGELPKEYWCDDKTPCPSRIEKD